jgi:hypothetical protein
LPVAHAIRTAVVTVALSCKQAEDDEQPAHRRASSTVAAAAAPNAGSWDDNADAAARAMETAAATAGAAEAAPAAAAAVALPEELQARTREASPEFFSHHPSWRFCWLYPASRLRGSWTRQGYPTLQVSPTRTCAPRGQLRLGQPRSFVPRRISAHYPTGSRQACRDSAWALDPGLSFGLVNRKRSELFCLAERL